jgi:signal transduction histidine kinase
VLCQVSFGVDSLNGAMAGEPGTRLETFLVALALWSATSFTVWGLARLAVRAEHRAEVLRSVEKLSATRAERLRLARELHDSVANAVTGMMLQAAGARAALPRTDPAVDQVLADIETAGMGAMDELHRMLHLLRSGAAADHTGRVDAGSRDLLDARALIGPAQAAGVSVDLVTSGDPVALDEAQGLALRRLVQESLTNTVKHAGSGARAVVELEWRSSGVGIRVEDARGAAVGPPGPGGDPGGSWGCGYGLAGLRERFTQLGGTFDGHDTRTGFLVTAWLPAPQPLHADPVAR